MHRPAFKYLKTAALLVTFGCADKPETPNVVSLFHIQNDDRALVGEISLPEYRQELARARLEREGKLSAAPLSSELKNALLDQMVETRILLWKAKQLQVKASTAAVSKEMQRMEQEMGRRELKKTLLRSYQRTDDLNHAIQERLTIGKLMRKAAHKGITVQESEVKKAWEKIPPNKKKVAKLVRAQQIVVQTEEEATEIYKLLRRGRDFAQLAVARSISPESKKGGDLGWFEKGVMPKIFDEACFSLKLGQTSPITPSEYGFHIFRVTGLEPERSLDFDALKDRIRSKVLHKKLQAAESEFVSKLRNEFEVVRNEPVLLSIN